MQKLTVAVLFGGASSEHDVSLVSATSVLNNLSSEKYRVLPIGITAEGRWFLYSGPADKLADGSWENDPGNVPAVLSPDPSHHGIIKLSNPVELLRVDCVFPVLHGKNGEDGTVQGLFELAGIPFVGCDLISSANCMDKQLTHTVLDAAGIRTAKWRVLRKADQATLDGQLPAIEAALGYPIFVKPANAGSSVGISKAHNRAELCDALALAFKHDRKAILEETIVGAEVECAVLGNDAPEASIPGQITPCNEFYDYNAKYIDNNSLLTIPADIPAEAAERLRAIALKGYTALGCAGLARVDFFVTAAGEIILNEINTLPGFTGISMYPKLWIAGGYSYGGLLDRLIALALERGGDCRG